MALVRIRNVGDVDFVDQFNSNPYRVPAGGEVIVDYDVACLWLGWPGLQDDPSKARMDRTERYNHLRLRYGWAEGLDAPEAWESMRPKLEVYTMEGDREYMILDDPDGQNARPAADQSMTNDLEWLKEQFARQERELGAMRAEIEARSAQGEVPDKLPEDSPRGKKVPVGKAQG